MRKVIPAAIFLTAIAALLSAQSGVSSFSEPLRVAPLNRVLHPDERLREHTRALATSPAVSQPPARSNVRTRATRVIKLESMLNGSLELT